MKQKILVAGLGLIGGSIAKALAASGQHHLIGYDTKERTIEYALNNGIIHSSDANFESAALKANIIIFATPISATIEHMKQLNEIPFTEDVIVTDVSSVKGSIIDQANKLTNKHITFIGGHPMAGSHKTGIEAAKQHLFENAIYVLIPTQTCRDEKVEQLKDILSVTNSHFLVLKPEEHDEMTSVISHFPHLIASSLVHQARKWERKHSYLPNLAAGGFRDITRIASSNPEMWEDIFYHNRDNMVQLLDEWLNEMKKMKRLIVKKDKLEMINYLKQAKEYRDGLGVERRGAIPSFHDLFVDVKDEPGALAKVIQLLADHSISITNTRILEIREGISGVLRLSFPTKEAQEKSYNILSEKGYEVSKDL